MIIAWSADRYLLDNGCPGAPWVVRSSSVGQACALNHYSSRPSSVMYARANRGSGVVCIFNSSSHPIHHGSLLMIFDEFVDLSHFAEANMSLATTLVLFFAQWLIFGWPLTESWQNFHAAHCTVYHVNSQEPESINKKKKKSGTGEICPIKSRKTTYSAYFHSSKVGT